MGIFTRIVVGVDGTDWGFEALRQSLLLSDEGSVIRTVTAVDIGATVHTGYHAPQFAEMLEREAEEARQAAETLIAGRPGCSTAIVRGKPADALRHERTELDATLVALGGRRSSRFLGILLGDTSTQLLHDAACSVLLAYPTDDGPWQPHRIIAGIDGSSYASAALEVAYEVAGRLGGEVDVVAATGGKRIERDADWAERVQSWDTAPPVDALVRRSETADLLVVGSRGAHGIRSIGSVSERVAHQARCTVIVVHEQPPPSQN